MKTIYYTATSLDGWIAESDNSLDWLFQFGDEDTGIVEFMSGVGAIAMGSATYEWVLANNVDPATGAALPWPYSIPAWVFSSRPKPTVPGADIRFVRGDVRPIHRDMVEAAGGKNVWLCGGGDLVGQFHDAGLLDEVIVQIASVTLGGGAPLLPRRIVTPPLRLLSVRQMGASFAELHYEVRRAVPEG